MLAQGVPTGSVSGRVTSAEGTALPGVTVTVTSPQLQGTRSATTSAQGDYNLPLLPPGDYQVNYELAGFLTAEHSVKVAGGLQARIDVELAPNSVSEEIVVTGTYETISTGSQDATTYEKEFIEQLAIDRDIRNTTLLTPGVSATGPTNAITISGALSYENLFLVNGVAVNENLRGQPYNLFIEDAIDETTISTSGISAEYGRFGGGVVNTITRSGGNELHGSLRTVFLNDDWIGRTPVSPERLDDINQRYEATLGGWVLKDRVWYFLAGRDYELSGSSATALTQIPYETGESETRLEGKLTVSPFQGHRLIGSYMEIEREETNARFQSILDIESLKSRTLPNELRALNYTGVLTESFFVEAQYSERFFAFEGDGSKFTDRIRGTLLIDDELHRWNSPTFCGICRPEERNNENIYAKASWFASTESLGSHDIAFGYDSFDDIRVADNHQSGSDFRVNLSDTWIIGTNLYPQLLNDNTTIITWNPILQGSRGTSFVTNSIFANDRWRLNENWSFNLGVRYDQNDGKDSSGKKVADDSRISPRLGLTFDPKGDGDWVFNASYGQYVSALANTQGDATSAAGNPANITWFYRGPNINPDGTPADQLISTEEALRRMFEWFDQQGGTNYAVHRPRSLTIPGETSRIVDGLKSPVTDEIALGVSKRLGNRGIARAEYVHREGHDFYVDRRDLTTGQVTLSNGSRADLSVIENEDDLLERTYDGLHTQFQYRVGDRLSLGGNYTLSFLKGNWTGENSASGPVRSTILQYPEYIDVDWFAPEGYLSADQRHRARVWGLFDLFKTDHHRLNLSVLQLYTSGTPYGALGAVRSLNYNDNPGYAIEPTSVAYFFTDRDEFTTEDITSTDLALNYSFTWNAFNKSMEVFIQPEVTNVFNEDGAILVDQTVRDNTTTTTIPSFNPFTETPVEGVHWQRGANFGKAVNETGFQTPRTFRFSVGFRF
ncbi:MAG TPA: TonB-dependent receptor [Thermoanaerobaculia bacterium]|nr:TonB-dependent receptor [Thermoanaerobaculia bacterium]